MGKIQLSIFSVFYSSTYTILLLILFVLLAGTPGDHIYQTISSDNTKLGNVFVVAGVYVVTGVIALFIYASRLYTNRITLAALPRVYLPIEEGEVSNKVRRLITRNRQRSALVAWDARPRDLRDEFGLDPNTADGAALSRLRTKSLTADNPIPISPSSPPWGKIEHPGWSSPSSSDLPDLQFITVVTELPNLIEAKAVSLAPPDHAFDFMSDTNEAFTAPPDPDVVRILQRAPGMGLRDYLAYLDGLGIIGNAAGVDSFVSQYEYARFSSYAVSEAEFRRLMAAFSDLLAGLVALDAATITRIQGSKAETVHSSPSSATGSVRRPGGPIRLAARSSTSSLAPSTGSVIHHDPSSS